MKQIPLMKTVWNVDERTEFALVDDQDYENLIKYIWHKSARNYCSTTLPKNPPVKISMHRFLMNPPKGMIVDHLDNNGLNNQRSNLEVVTYSENSRRAHARIKAGRLSKWQEMCRRANME